MPPTEGRTLSDEEVTDFIRAATGEVLRSALSVSVPSLHAVQRILSWAHASNHRVILHGVGRERLMLSSLAMRLFHLGLRKVSMFGDMTCPAIAHNDVLIVSAGPGHFNTVDAVVKTANREHARTVCFTAHPDNELPSTCDIAVRVSAATMNHVPQLHDDGGRVEDGESNQSVLPMGSTYEGALFIVFETLIEMLRVQLDVSFSDMEQRHTNLE